MQKEVLPLKVAVSAECRNLLEALLERDSHRRPTAAAALHLPWLGGAEQYALPLPPTPPPVPRSISLGREAQAYASKAVEVLRASLTSQLLCQVGFHQERCTSTKSHWGGLAVYWNDYSPSTVPACVSYSLPITQAIAVCGRAVVLSATGPGAAQLHRWRDGATAAGTRPCRPGATPAIALTQTNFNIPAAKPVFERYTCL